MEPQLFQSAVDQQLQRLKEEKEAKEESVRKSQEEDSSSPQRSKSDLVLYQRMEEVRAARAVVHYMLWFCVSTHFLLRPAFTLQQKRQGLVVRMKHVVCFGKWTPHTHVYGRGLSRMAAGAQGRLFE